MKLFIKTMLVVVILAVGGLFILKKPDGTPWLKVDDFTSSTSPLKEVAEQLKSSWNDGEKSANELVEEKVAPEKSAIYRWKSSDGKWHMSDIPPTVDTPVEIVYIEPNGNVIDLSSNDSQSTSDDKASHSAAMIPLPMTTSPQQAKKLIDDAKNIQALLDKRAEKLKAAVD
ncbi:MAG: hypothetical protein ACPGSN_08950 [Psychrobium sp.]